MLKAAIKHGAAGDQVRHRIIQPEAAYKWAETLESLKDEVSAVLQDEKQEKQVGNATLPYFGWLTYGWNSFSRLKWS